MKRVAGVLALVLMVSLLGASDVRGFALAPAGKTTGNSLVATIVIDVTPCSNSICSGPNDITTGLTSIRVQRSSVSTAALFTAGTLKTKFDGCTPGDPQLQAAVAAGFTGLISTLVDTPNVLNALFVPFGFQPSASPVKEPAIISQDYPACTYVLDGQGGGTRQILSFTAVVQFEK